MSTVRETQWLDADEQRIWAQLSTMILRLQPVLSAELQREFGISHFEYLVMTRPRTVTRSAASTRGAAGYAADASERKISAELNRMRRWRQLGDQREAELCNDRINDLLHRFRCGSGPHVGTRQTVVHLGV